jgi:hypothetical protein
MRKVVRVAETPIVSPYFRGKPHPPYLMAFALLVHRVDGLQGGPEHVGFGEPAEAVSPM